MMVRTCDSKWWMGFTDWGWYRCGVGCMGVVWGWCRVGGVGVGDWRWGMEPGGWGWRCGWGMMVAVLVLNVFNATLSICSISNWMSYFHTKLLSTKIFKKVIIPTAWVWISRRWIKIKHVASSFICMIFCLAGTLIKYQPFWGWSRNIR